jgi:predicted ATP-dependent endonuclease of OLD family
MIKIQDISIENFRSIAGKPLNFTFGNYCVIVGPNNSGKSNILRALQLFFNGHIDGLPFDAAIDFPKCKELSNRAQTQITVTLQYDPAKDLRVDKAIKQLETESNQERLSGNLLRLRLECTQRNAIQWRFFSKAGLRNIRAELVAPVVEAIRSSVRFKYLPVGRDILETIRNELSEELITTIFSGWSGAVKARKEINETIDTLISKLQPRLKDSAVEITTAISSVFGEIKRLELRLPFNNLETMLPSLMPAVRDSYETPLNQKGAGIQTSTLLFLLKYLADHHPQRHHLRVTYIWAIEEPESFLHPSRQKGMANILTQFSNEVQTIVTTHSPHFVPRSAGAGVLIVDKETISPYSTVIIGMDYNLARQTLGVSLLDSMYLYPYNIVVEGPSNEILLRGAWEKLYAAGKITIDPTNVKFFAGGNASGACTLFESFITFGDAGEVDIRLVIDGDHAGKKALLGLLARTKQTKVLGANRDYFELESTTEWMTSTKVIEAVFKKYPTSVTLKKNTKDKITGIIIQDGQKKKIAKSIIDSSDIDDLSGYQELISKIETSFVINL